MNRVLILGGGFGGVAAANRLRDLLPTGDEIVLVDRRAHFMVGFRKTWALVGESSLEAGLKPLKDLEKKGIRVIQGTITGLDPEARTAFVDGVPLKGDALIVALGAELAPDQVPGFSAHALNVYDRAEIPRAAGALAAFTGGRVLIGIFSPLYKCPPAPFEVALKVREYFMARAVPADVGVFTPLPMSLPILGTAGCEVIESRLANNGIRFLANHTATAVEAGQVRFKTGVVPYDLLLGIPPHRAPKVLEGSGLAGEGGWVRVDARTLETGFPGVYAVGDMVGIGMANGKPLPKAGVFAEAEGRVAAERIAAAFAGRPAETTFDGEGGCFLEVGGDQAVMVRGRFLAEPAPDVEITAESAELLEAKRAFESGRLQVWF